MAAEQIGRRAFCMEIDPIYADVCIRRWQTYTKRDAVLASTGQTFNELEASRTFGDASSAHTAPRSISAKVRLPAHRPNVGHSPASGHQPQPLRGAVASLP